MRKDFPELRQPRVKYAKHPPRILFFGPDSRLDSLWSVPEPSAAPGPPPDDLVNTERMTRRIQALKSALEDLPRQARRMARWRVRRETLQKLRSSNRHSGRVRLPATASGYIHPIDEIRADCHWTCLGGDEARHKLRLVKSTVLRIIWSRSVLIPGKAGMTNRVELIEK